MPTNPFYDSSGWPSPKAKGSTASFRAEYDAIEAGFAKIALPTLNTIPVGDGTRQVARTVVEVKAILAYNKSDLSLGNVDNTSDANKPVSSPQQTALNLKANTLVSGTNIKTVNSVSIVGPGDVVVQPTLVSGTNIKTVNSVSIVGPGDVVVQPTLVSGANIKTVNSVSIVGPGDVSTVSSTYIDQSARFTGSQLSLVIPDSKAMINGTFVSIAAATLTLSTAGNWDAATYATAANRAGKDFYIYALQAGGVILSANTTYPTGYTAANTRKLGGFHCLAVAVGAISGHTLTGYAAGDILPASVWGLRFRPVCSPEGMVYSAAADVWVDIYMQSGTGTATRSLNAATITDTRTYWDHGDDLAAVGKRMLCNMEFSAIASGAPEATNITGSADPGITGGHVDTAARRIISHIGCEDCVGVLWHWIDGGHVYRNDDGAYAGGWSWKATGGRGQELTQGANGSVGLLAGGPWNAGSDCGSRSRAANDARSAADSRFGSRGCARSQT